MPKFRVYVSYWGGYTGDREWQDRARSAFEARGWSDIYFGNQHDDNYVPFSTNVDADEIRFIAEGEAPDRASVTELLKQFGIEHCDVSIDEYKPG